MAALTRDESLTAGAGDAPRSLDAQIEFEVFDMVARGLAEGLAAGVIPLATTALLLQTLAAPRLLVPWAAGVAAVLGAGLVLAWRYGRAPQVQGDTARWRLALFALVGASGLSWGVAGWLFVPAPWQAELVVLALLLSLAAAVLANIGAELPLYAVFVSAIMLPTAVHRAVLGGAVNLGISVGALVMILVLTLFAARLAAAMRRSLRIAHENRRLADALAERTREAELASQAKSRFIAAASHDLRQPVHALGLLLDVLQGQQLNPQAQATAARMSQVFEALDGLFEGLLDISRLDSGAIEPRRCDFALGPLLAALADEFAAEAQAKGLALRCRGSDAWVRSDPLLLERMLRNLLANAVRYTERGGVLIGCRSRGGSLRIEVRDSGIGIAAAQQAAVFDEFFQVGNTERARGQGLGLGLAIVRRLGALLGHPLTLRSWPGRGSVFGITLPAVVAPAAVATPAPRAADAQAAAWRDRHVLVVEDDAFARDALERLLAAWGCQVSCCADATALRDLLRARAAAPDLLITDWRLPGPEDGLAVVQLLRTRFGGALPACLITGDAVDDARRVEREHGVVLLHKPIRPAALRAALTAQWMPVPGPAVALP
ncbi:MAG: hybrid sensor histidine kinase/response regulator [Burkholderiaceae bacterium]|nr:hybrid sensor histidine kinase/response regulator [Burkholderiaceae bacterium]